MEGGDSDFTAPCCDILGSQHSSVWGRLVAICLDFHSTYVSCVNFLACIVAVMRDAPVTREMVSFPDKSVTCTKVSLNDAYMCATPKTSSPSATWGPSWTAASSLGALTFLGGWMSSDSQHWNPSSPGHPTTTKFPQHKQYTQDKTTLTMILSLDDVLGSVGQMVCC